MKTFVPPNLWAQIMIPLITMWVLVTLSVTATTFGVGQSLEKLKLQLEASSEVSQTTVRLLHLRALSRELILQYRLSQQPAVKTKLFRYNMERAAIVDRLRQIGKMDHHQSRFLTDFERAG